MEFGFDSRPYGAARRTMAHLCAAGHLGYETALALSLRGQRVEGEFQSGNATSDLGLSGLVFDTGRLANLLKDLPAGIGVVP